MKRRILSITAVLMMTIMLAALLPGCNTNSTPSSSETGEVSDNPSTPDTPESEATDGDKLYVADAKMYRGTVTQLEDGTMVLEAYPGSFVTKTMDFIIDESTRANFDIETLAVGDHLEVFYGGVNTDGTESVAIAMNRLPAAEMVYYNGTIVDTTETDSGIRLTMASLDMPEDVSDADRSAYYTVFNVTDETQLYISESDLVPGTALNIYHKGVMALSLPPQGAPLEIRLMVVEE